jgi:oxysterol-binding protein 1
VDAAFGERDPLRRIAFVAAFAMSNYSSTIGRIAKPFNPMLVRFFLTGFSLVKFHSIERNV